MARIVRKRFRFDGDAMWRKSPRTSRLHSTISPVGRALPVRPICTWPAKVKDPVVSFVLCGANASGAIRIRVHTNPWMREHVGRALRRRQSVRCRQAPGYRRTLRASAAQRGRTLKSLILGGSVVPKVTHFRDVALVTFKNDAAVRDREPLSPGLGAPRHECFRQPNGPLDCFFLRRIDTQIFKRRRSTTPLNELMVNRTLPAFTGSALSFIVVHVQQCS